METTLLVPAEGEAMAPKTKVLDGNKAVNKIEAESFLSVSLQIFFPFLVAGLGMVAAGLVLDQVQHWHVFEEISELFILVPALLGLKGNLEMTLASRLSTAANTGKMETRQESLSLIVGNLALIQSQAIVVGLFASLVGSGMGAVKTMAAGLMVGWTNTTDATVVDPARVNFDVNHCILLLSSALVTASVASFVLGLVMVLVIVGSRRCNLNPDNIATPIAASLGDLTTLVLLSWAASLLWSDMTRYRWLAPVIITAYLLLTPLFAYIAYRNPRTRSVLYSGWRPVLVAML